VISIIYLPASTDQFALQVKRMSQHCSKGIIVINSALRNHNRRQKENPPRFSCLEGHFFSPLHLYYNMFDSALSIPKR
jgi:hypothetical protein